MSDQRSPLVSDPGPTSGTPQVCDGLKGLPDVVEHVWPQTVVQTCIIHLIRNTFRLASRAVWGSTMLHLSLTSNDW
jgi:transposase-like protein